MNTNIGAWPDKPRRQETRPNKKTFKGWKVGMTFETRYYNNTRVIYVGPIKGYPNYHFIALVEHHQSKRETMVMFSDDGVSSVGLDYGVYFPSIKYPENT